MRLARKNIVIAYALTCLMLVASTAYYFQANPAAVPLMTRIALLYACESAILGGILLYLRISPWVVALALAAGFLQHIFMARVGTTESAPDIFGHMRYIEYLSKNAFIPPAPIGFQPTQPPLYYMFMTLFYNAGQALGIQDVWQVVRYAARSVYLGYIVLCLVFIERLRLLFLPKLFLAGIVLFWPTAHLLSVRINNDLGFMMFFMATVVALQRWQERYSPRNLAVAMACAGLSVLCKATGFMSVVAVAACASIALFRKKISWRFFLCRPVIIGGSAALLSLGYYFGRIFYHRLTTGDVLHWFANVQSGQEQFGPITYYHLFYLNLREFVVQPGIDWDQMWANRYTFWGYMFRTLLYSEGYSYSLIPSSLINGLWLCVIVLALWQLRPKQTITSQNTQSDLIIVCIISMLALYILQRLIVPDTNLGYGRRIQPISLFFAALAAQSMQEASEKKQRVLYAIMVVTGLAFVAASCERILASFIENGLLKF